MTCVLLFHTGPQERPHCCWVSCSLTESKALETVRGVFFRGMKTEAAMQSV